MGGRNWKLVLIYTLIAAVVAFVTAPIPGTSLLLTGLEIYMVVHLSKKHDFKLGIKEIGLTSVTIWGISTLLQDTALEVLTFFPGIGWFAEAIVAAVFVFFLGSLADLYFKK